MSPAFSEQLLVWFDRHGRKDLPWQRDRDPYRIWISEIMLQQTRVDTVIPYYEKFIHRFSDIEKLAVADIDEVLHYWTGLGYYARARNMHKAARELCRRSQGKFPEDIDAMTALPGIGRSTAAAVLALSFGKRHAILDGNVKRVLTRYFEVEGWPGKAKVEKQLWESAESLLPDDRMADYTQALMDLGATLCTRVRPDCRQCPVQGNCIAFKKCRQHELPAPRPTRDLPRRNVHVALIRNKENAVWLERRPSTGIWGGLYSFPEFEKEADLQKWLTDTCKMDNLTVRMLPVITHTFSHFRLHMHPTVVLMENNPIGVMEDDDGVWYKAIGEKIGLAAPVRKALLQVI
ncbi:MAG: A/G-specific adenine glycosylase [Gammaproteobacteria bacterium]|nr:A/G-specific adenine glycosylase [Gammaproteobacteria bacterium]